MTFQLSFLAAFKSDLDEYLKNRHHRNKTALKVLCATAGVDLPVDFQYHSWGRSGNTKNSKAQRGKNMKSKGEEDKVDASDSSEHN